MQTRIPAPRSFETPDTHWHQLLQDGWYTELLRIQHALDLACHSFFSARGMLTPNLPLTTGSISSPMGLGSDSIPVQVSLFDVDTYLSDSMQFGLELTCRLNPQGTYFVMPSFRGEQSDASHLSQFYHAEAEIPGTLEDIIELGTAMVTEVTESLLGSCRISLDRLAGGTEHMEELVKRASEIPRMRLSEAIRSLGSSPEWVRRHEAGFQYLTKAGERELVRRHGVADALWVTHFPHTSVPFYQAYEPGTDYALNADLLLGGLETIGAGQRHEDYASLIRSLEEHEVEPDAYRWYIELREKTPMLTSGMGMGLERYLLWALSHDDIRDLAFLVRENGLEINP